MKHKWIKIVSFSLLLLLIGEFASPSLLFAQRKGKNKFTVVIDPGHGGKDAGAVAHGGREKDINLAVGLRVGEMISKRFPNVKVLYTRTTDVFIGLQQRANFANKNKADLFMSIHTNSAKSSASGVETYVLGLWRNEDNLRVAMKENESILLEENYERTYKGFDPSSSESYIMFELLQNKHLDQSIEIAKAVQDQLGATSLINRGVRQAGFLVIRETAMPSILIELGFISNRNEAAFLLSQRGQQTLANAIVEGFGNYYKAYNKSFGVTTVENTSTPEPEPEIREEESLQEPTVETEVELAEQPEKAPVVEEPAKSKGETYAIQIMALKKKVSTKNRDFKGEKVRCERNGRNYCYMVDISGNRKMAEKQLKKYKKKFPGAYIVIYKNGVRQGTIY
ncbi:N-acetylmuramoyl-L-alanine amidase family protein [Porphyromonas circumdentaria]|uniref:N-acetylmuramoyl-L-alanine amidase n=1 Tax=Porphyromonas circumdentaria TaxID=29524 RepID=A0A1T4NTK7_9PORP|nr:N-acetylmuramoyl-L-alanine amidase [Porphyromonas circumdentaria]MBB6276191.1 N-acetylmuramoyl-L-alanine amidase [Porphyromonas circumdentaria]MDO4722322.1 N-acetylmuramoyl-L-alanine amidase [Porphyromonas circumdentaria]SJZ82467.1 N-acetylmuramoyl-L-alanine amidase [Porphyromonas circumdentaria]